jgi:predicted HAD superfamily Cof-like phosphohydrolase
MVSVYADLAKIAKSRLSGYDKNEDSMTDQPYRPQQDIVTLMQLYNQQVKESPELPDAATRLLRARLVFEEALEFVKGCGCTVVLAGAGGAEQAAVLDGLAVELDPKGQPDFVEYVDGCIDQLVVTYGALNAAGVQAQPAWDEVQRSNLSKAWPHCSVCDAELALDANQQFVHPEGAPAHSGDWRAIPKIHKRADGKVIKSPTYSPANIRRVLDEQI